MARTTRSPVFEPVPLADVDWAELDRFADRNLFQTRAWLAFLAEMQGAEPVIARLQDGSQTLGYFTGLIVQRWGLRFLGSPLPGWTTPYMGFNLAPGVPRRLGAAALPALAFHQLGCVHVELRDRWLTDADASGLGYGHRRDVGFDERTFEVDLADDEDVIFGRMTSACRRAIRKAEKSGVTIEEASDPAFADEFYDQLRDVFLRQGLVPTYDVTRVRTLIRHLQPAGLLLLLRARDAEGRCIATGIFPAFGDLMFFWGGASYRAHQHNRPNEALHWYAMRYWKARGARRYDLGGFMDYKRKYGGVEIAIPGYRQSRYAWVAAARSLAPAGMRAKQTVLGLVQRRVRAWTGHLAEPATPAGEASA